MNEKKLRCNSKEKKDQETFSVGNGEKPYNNYTVLVNWDKTQLLLAISQAHLLIRKGQ